MKQVTADTLNEFSPHYQGYAARRVETTPLIGVTSDRDLKDYRGAIERINRESGIGLNDRETNILALVLTEEQANIRFSNNKFIHPDLGGNTAEHPLFMCMKIDQVRDRAGFGPSHFEDLAPATQLAAARLSQQLHTMALMHDTGELIDIAYSEQKATGASFKEPEEEKLVGPFKVLLAAHAISACNPSLYIAKMHEMRKAIAKKKAELYSEAINKNISGDDFVRGVGKEVGRLMSETEAQLAADSGNIVNTLRPEYKEAAQNLTTAFEQAEEMKGFSGAMLNLMDKLQGSAHYRHFAGRGRASPETLPILERLFPDGKAVSHHLASSAEVMNTLPYAQKTIPRVFEEAGRLAPGPEKDVAIAFARSGAASLLENDIHLLQKSPPLIDLDRKDVAAVFPTSDPERQQQFIDQRLDALRNMKRDRLASHQPSPVKEVKGTVDTKTLIAVLTKAASAIENGSYVPKATDIPIGVGELPPELQVTSAEIARSARLHPLETETAYKASGYRI